VLVLDVRKCALTQQARIGGSEVGQTGKGGQHEIGCQGGLVKEN
jgi:hypothetical protein